MEGKLKKAMSRVVAMLLAAAMFVWLVPMGVLAAEPEPQPDAPPEVIAEQPAEEVPEPEPLTEPDPEPAPEPEAPPEETPVQPEETSEAPAEEPLPPPEDVPEVQSEEDPPLAPEGGSYDYQAGDFTFGDDLAGQTSDFTIPYDRGAVAISATLAAGALYNSGTLLVTGEVVYDTAEGTDWDLPSPTNAGTYKFGFKILTAETDATGLIEVGDVISFGTFTISQKALTVDSSLELDFGTYAGETSYTKSNLTVGESGANINGLVTGDTVTATATWSSGDSSVLAAVPSATGQSVAIELAGTDASNYSITNPATINVVLAAKPITLTSPVYKAIVIDGVYEEQDVTQYITPDDICAADTDIVLKATYTNVQDGPPTTADIAFTVAGTRATSYTAPQSLNGETVTVEDQTPTVTTVIADPDDFASDATSLDTVITVDGSYLTDGISVGLFLPGSSSPDLSGTTALDADSGKQQATITLPANTTAGNQVYTVKVALDGSTWLEDTDLNPEITVAPAPLGAADFDISYSGQTPATPENLNVAYTASNISITLAPKSGGRLDGVQGSAVYAAPGTNVWTVTPKDAGSYKLGFKVSVTGGVSGIAVDNVIELGTFAVAKANLTVNMTAITFPYSGGNSFTKVLQAVASAGDVNGQQGSDVVNVTAAFTHPTLSKVNAGGLLGQNVSFTLDTTGAGANYQLTGLNDGIKTLNITISKAELTQGSSLPDTYTATYNATNTVEFTVETSAFEGLVAGDDLEITASHTGGSKLDADDYTNVQVDFAITGGTDEDNYTFASGEDAVTADVTVDPLQLALNTTIDYRMLYKADPPYTIDVSGEATNVINGDTVDVTATFTFAGTLVVGANTADVSFALSGTDGDNYLAPASRTGVQVIVRGHDYDLDDFTIGAPDAGKNSIEDIDRTYTAAAQPGIVVTPKTTTTPPEFAGISGKMLYVLKGASGFPAANPNTHDTAPTLAGEYQVYFYTLNANGVDTLTFDPLIYLGVLTVDKADLTIDTTSLSTTYNGKNNVEKDLVVAASAGSGVDVSGLLGTDDVTVTARYSQQDKLQVSDSGAQEFTIALGSSGDEANYQIAGLIDGKKSLNLTVNPARLALTGTLSALTVTFDNARTSITQPLTSPSHFTGVVAGDDAPTLEAVWNKGSLIDCGDTGSYDFTISITDGNQAGNYALATGSTSVQLAVTVNKAKIRIERTSADPRRYDGTTTASNPTAVLVPAASNRIANFEASLASQYTATGVYDNPNAGLSKTVKVTVTLTGDALQNLAFENGENTHDCKIALLKAQAELVTLVPADKVYDGTPNAKVTATFQLAGGGALYGTDSLSGQYTVKRAEFTQADVGTALGGDADIELLPDSNYVLIDETALPFTDTADITPRPVRFKAKDQTVFVGHDLSTLTHSFTVENLAAGEYEGSALAGFYSGTPRVAHATAASSAAPGTFDILVYVDDTASPVVLRDSNYTWATNAAGSPDKTIKGTLTIKPILVTGVSLDKATADITEGDTLQLAATVAPANATNPTVSFTTSNAAVATVSDSGLVTAVAPGTATITVTTADGSFTASCAITVLARYIPVTAVALNTTDLTLEGGQTHQLTATVTPTDATAPAVTYSSSDAAIASVDAAGLVTALKEGQATITAATADVISASCAVTVHAPVGSIKLSQTAVNITTNKTVTVKAVAYAADGSELDANITWSSSNEGIATVNADGKITPKKASSSNVKITATSNNGKSASVTVKVVAKSKAKKVTKVRISSPPKTLQAGKTKTLKAKITPSNATNAAVTWKSSNTKVLRVDAAGKLTAIKEGTAKITLSAGGEKATATVKVTAPVSSIKLDKTKVTLSKKGKTTTIKPTVTYTIEGGSAKLTWKSSNTKVATVSSKGKITAKGKGKATITVSASNGKKAKVTVTVSK